MAQLFLIYDDENGEHHRVPIDRDVFVVGRHPENDLPISSSKLSREHIEILRSGNDFVVEDVGSTNGTKLNGAELAGSEVLFDGDILNLGDGVEIHVKFGSSDDLSKESGLRGDDDEESVEQSFDSVPIGSGSLDRVASSSTPSSSGSDFGKLFVIAAVLLFFVFVVAGSAIFLLRDTTAEVVRERNNSDFEVPLDEDDDDDPADSESPNPLPTASAESNKPPENFPTTKPSTEPVDDLPTPKPRNNSNAKLEQAAVSFMRRIARNDSRPVLTSRQIAVVQSKVNQYKGAGGLSSNIKNARANSDAIISLARSKNLKPQFLAVAAIAKLGRSSSDVLSTARAMAEVLDNLNIQIGDELADESLVTIAAYQQGVSGKFLKMRNTMRKLSDENPNASSRQIRSIWFLRDKGKLSNADFEFALRFLAIGTITQNPKAFGVNGEALKL